MSRHEVLELPIEGMNCAHCALDIQRSIAGLPGVESVEVLHSAGKAVVRLDPERADMAAIRGAVEGTGCSVSLPTLARPERAAATEAAHKALPAGFGRSVLALFAAVFAAVLFVVVIGEWLGFFEAYTERVPWPIGMAIVLVFGCPVFRNVIRAALRRRITSHTLMTVGLLAALAVGQWPTRFSSFLSCGWPITWSASPPIVRAARSRTLPPWPSRWRASSDAAKSAMSRPRRSNLARS